MKKAIQYRMDWKQKMRITQSKELGYTKHLVIPMQKIFQWRQTSSSYNIITAATTALANAATPLIFVARDSAD